MAEQEEKIQAAATEATAEQAEAAQGAAAEDAAKPRAGRAKAPAKASRAKKGSALEDIMETIKNMTVLELAELVKALEDEFGVTAAAPVAVAAPGGAEAAAAEVEEKTEFNVILKDFGANKINVIKAVREITSLGLKESKDLVEAAPKSVREAVGREEADAMKEKLEAAGATVEIT